MIVAEPHRGEYLSCFDRLVRNAGDSSALRICIGKTCFFYV